MWGLKTAGPRLQCTIRVWKYKFSFLDSNLVHLFFWSLLDKKKEKRKEKITQKKQTKKKKKINEVCCLSGSLEASNSWILSKADVKYEWGLVWMSQAALSCQWIKEQGRGINEDSRNYIYCWAKKWKKNHREAQRSSQIVRCGASKRAWTHVGSVRVHAGDPGGPTSSKVLRVKFLYVFHIRACAYECRVHTRPYSPEVERPLVAHAGNSLTRRSESKSPKSKTPPSFHSLTWCQTQSKERNNDKTEM